MSFDEEFNITEKNCNIAEYNIGNEYNEQISTKITKKSTSKINRVKMITAAIAAAGLTFTGIKGLAYKCNCDNSRECIKQYYAQTFYQSNFLQYKITQN